MKNGISFEAKDKPIRDILYGNYRFRVPRYQRPYAWEEDQIEEFWNDLLTSREPYFLGSLIFNYESLKETGYIDIIDGQQRLLTIIVFSAALRDVAREIEPSLANLIHRKNIVIEDLDGSFDPIIEPGESIKRFFDVHIFEEDNKILGASLSTKEEKRVHDNYDYLYQKLLAEVSRYSNKSEKINCIRELRGKVQELIAIEIKIESEEDAYEIFETTNARGVDLSIADLLKNLIFKELKPKVGADFAKEIWSDIVNNIEETGAELKRFIRYYWISRHSLVQEKRLFREIKRNISNWEGLLYEIWSASQWYNKLLVLNENDWQEIKNGMRIYKSISAIKYMGVTQCYVLFLSILRNIDQINTNPLRIFELIERFTFNYAAVCKQPANKVEKIYSKYATAIERIIQEVPDKHIPGEVQSIFEQLCKELKEQRPNREFFKDKFREITYNNSDRSRQFIKYILEKIEDYYSTGEKKTDFKVSNLEHILPRNPHKDWHLSKEDIKPYVNKLGNLTLLHEKINSKIGNKTIREKIQYLKGSEFKITEILVRQLEEQSYKWNQEEIEERQNLLAEIAYDYVWDF